MSLDVKLVARMSKFLCPLIARRAEIMVVYTDIKCDTLEYKNPVKNKMGGTVVYVSTVPGKSDFNTRLRFQMSCDACDTQEAVWDVSAPPENPTKKTLELTITPQLQSFLEKLDKRNEDEAVQNCGQWFPKVKQASEPVIRGMYKTILKQESGRDDYTVKVKIRSGEAYPTKIWRVTDEKEGKIQTAAGSEDLLKKGSKIMVIVDTPGLWFMTNQYGMSLTATDVIVWPVKSVTGLDAFFLGEGMVVENRDVDDEMADV